MYYTVKDTDQAGSRGGGIRRDDRTSDGNKTFRRVKVPSRYCTTYIALEREKRNEKGAENT